MPAGRCGPPEGFEPPSSSSAKPPVSETGAARSAAFGSDSFAESLPADPNCANRVGRQVAVSPSLSILAQLTLDFAQLIEKLETTLVLVDVAGPSLVRDEVIELAIQFTFLLQ